MSIARHHAEWLSLVPVSGPFLSLPVLMEAFNTGLEPHDPDHVRDLRQEYAAWQEACTKHRGDPIPHHHWVRFVLTQTLGLDKEVLAEGQAISQTLQVEVPEHHEFLRPTIALLDPSSKKPRLLVQVYPRVQEISNYVSNSSWKASPDTRMTELLHGTGVRLGLITNGEHWMLVDAAKGETTGYSSWYSALWLEEPITLRAFRTLLSANRFFGVPDEQTLESLLKKSAENQTEVTDQLGYQVRKAVEVLIHSLDKADQDFGRELLADITPEQLYESALTVMMRLVFLFCAEERELIPSKPFPVFEENYSVSTISKQLRELADQHGEELLERRYDAWPRLLAAFRIVYGGLRHDDLHMPAYGGSLFNPDRFPFLEGRKSNTCWRDTEASPLPVNNRAVLHLLEALQLLQVKLPGGGAAEARRLSFRALDIEQIGHVYEGLLDHTAKRAEEPFLGLAGGRNSEPEITLAELEKEREKGEKEFLKYLKEQTGRSEPTLKKALASELEPTDTARFKTACQGDTPLWSRVKPFAPLVRMDNFGYPVVIPTSSVFVTAGTDRRSSGTHYTPRSLTEPIVRYTLEPLVYTGPAEGLPKPEWKLKPARDLLDLKICDMACGSGAFLVQAARYMAERLLEAWDSAKQQNPGAPSITPEGLPSSGKADESIIPEDAAERKTYAMRIVVQRCLYGVDKNPLAVEMAKLSLWLLTLAKDKPFEFLDHAIRWGDSLVGIHSLEQLKKFSLKPEAEDATWFQGPLEGAVDEAIALRLKLEDMPANTVEDVKRQERLLDESKEKMGRLRCAADLLVSAEFWGQSPKDKLERVRHAAVKSGYYIEKGPTDEFERVAAKERRGQTMFHWPLEFPEVIVKRGGFDGFVGNPPFMGGKKISGALGIPYREFVHSEIGQEVKGSADLCAFFFLRAFKSLAASGGFGLLATNTIAQAGTREVGLDQIAASGCSFIRASPNIKWPGVAAVTVTCVWGSRKDWSGPFCINDAQVKGINSSLDVPGSLVGDPHRLAANLESAFQGTIINGTGFLIETEHANALLERDVSNRDVLFPFLGGDDFNSRSDQSATRWAINFHEWSEDRARQYPDCWKIVVENVKPFRETISTTQVHEPDFWKFWDKRVKSYEAISSMPRILAGVLHTKFWSVEFQTPGHIFSHALVVFILDDFASFALLQCTFHEIWAIEHSSSLGVALRYTARKCFDTFPFVRDHSLNSLGKKYQEYRKSLMLKHNEGLTRTYSRFHDSKNTSADIHKLRDQHAEMDQAVAAAYGWTDLELGHGFHETKQGIRFTISESARREVLQRLLKLNHERYAEEVKQGLHDKKKPAAKKAGPGRKPAKAKGESQSSLFDEGEEE